MISPKDFGDQATKIAYLLQNLDTDGNLNNGIQLPNNKYLTQITKNSATIDSIDIDNIKNQLEALIPNANFPNISQEEALNNLNQYLHSLNSTNSNNTQPSVQNKQNIDQNTTTTTSTTTFQTSNLIDEVEKNGLLALVNKKLYVAYDDAFIPYSDDMGTMTITNDKITLNLQGGIYNSSIIAITKDYIKLQEDDGDIATISKLKLDKTQNLIILNDNDGLYIISTSQKAINNYVNNLKMKYPRTPIDPQTLKGIFLYNMEDNKYLWLAAKLEDNQATIYDIEDIGDAVIWDEEDSYENPNNVPIQYTSTNTLKYLDDGEWKENKVYQYHLANKTLDAIQLGALFDSINLFSVKLQNLGINEINFTKGNAYCELLWDECWIDKNAVAEIFSAFENLSGKYAIKKGTPKTPRYSKFSDYLKNGYIYDVDTIDKEMYYEINYIENGQFCYKELQTSNNDEELSQSCDDLTADEADSMVKIISEYDNGVLVEVNDHGLHYKQFFYNNKEDAKQEFQFLLPKYQ